MNINQKFSRQLYILHRNNIKSKYTAYSGRTTNMSKRSFFKFLEDTDHPSVAPNLKILTFAGLYRSKIKSPFDKLKGFFFYAILLFFFSQYIKCCFNFNAESLQLILQYAPFHMGILKMILFRKDFNKWKDLIDYMSSIEKNQLAKADEKKVEILNKYISRCHKITYGFCTLSCFTNSGIFSEPFRKNEFNENGTSVYLHIFDGYVPYSVEPPGYYISMFIQIMLGNILSVYIIGWDTLVVALMIFFAKQLKISRIYWSQAVVVSNAVKSHENIAKCHQFHVTLIKYQQLFNSLISTVMFVYLFIVSVNLGVCIIQIVQVPDLSALISNCLFMVACLVQLLLFYWHSNEVIVESTYASYSCFESDWPDSIIKLQKEMLLLNITASKRLVFNAGPFSEMSLPTFIGILRASYSYYTLLRTTA